MTTVNKTDATGLRLFKVVHNDKTYHFTSKRTAMVFRDKADYAGVIMRGPDHRRGESFNEG